MNKYHKIQTVFKRDPETKFKTLLLGQYSLPEFLYLRDVDWVFTEKVDGTNIRIINDGGKCVIKGKTDRAQLHPNLVRFAEDVMAPRISSIPEGCCLYGEGYGAGIQKGGLYRSDQSFVLFDVKIGNYFMDRSEITEIAVMLGVDVVPIVGKGTLGDMVEMVRNGFQSDWGDFQAEGIVARPAIELRTKYGDRVITKLKTKDFGRATP